MPEPSEQEKSLQSQQIARLQAIAQAWYAEQERGTLTPDKDAKYQALTDAARADFDSYARYLQEKYYPS